VGEAIFLLIAGVLTVGVACAALHRMAKAKKTTSEVQSRVASNGASSDPTSDRAPY
jgi:hypothetical protein